MANVQKIKQTGKLPDILIAEEELEPLSNLAEALLDAMPEVGHFLDDELSRARLVPRKLLPRGIVTINALVNFVWGPGLRTETLKLVYPADHSSDGQSVSIASPVGVALLGLRAGQSMTWSSRRGDLMSLTVTSVQAAA